VAGTGGGIAGAVLGARLDTGICWPIAVVAPEAAKIAGYTLWVNSGRLYTQVRPNVNLSFSLFDGKPVKRKLDRDRKLVYILFKNWSDTHGRRVAMKVAFDLS
jgi:hypothetical protein